MAHSLPRSRPSEQQVDAAALEAVLDVLEAHPDIEMHSLMVVRHGHVVAEGWWSPYTPDRRHLLYSLSKSFTSVAVGFAREEGLLDLDEPLVSCFPELDAEVDDPRSRSIRLRHVASMASGHTHDMLGDAIARDPSDPVRGFLLSPPDEDPGSVFAYSQPCTYALASVVQSRAGESLSDYLRPRLFDPLGIGDVGWTAWEPGREIGFSGLHARTEDVAKLGLLHLRRGRWGDRQLLPEDWVDLATSKHVDNPDQPNPDWCQGYGFQFWMARHGYRGDGAYGQFCVVLPEHDTVVATTARTEQMQAVLDAFWTHLLPGLSSAGGPEADERLAARLRALRLPPYAGGAAPTDLQPWLGGPFVARRGVFGPVASALESVTLSVDDGRLSLALLEDDNELPVAVGTDDWLVTTPTDRHGAGVPVAASGEWVDDHTLRVAVIFLETPHRLELTLTLHGREVLARWPSPPLSGDRIADLHCP
jgi:CubicO group peptidase (beta-lactamase class C family)